MLPTKRKKRSGLSGIELQVTMTAIQNLIAKWLAEREVDDDGDGDDDDSPDITQLQAILNLLQTKLEGPQGYTFSGMTFEHLDKFQISDCGRLTASPDYISRALKTNSVGEDEHWSAIGLYRHLCLLEGLVPRTNEAAARLWINAFFFRVATMSPGNSKIVLSVEQNVPSVSVNPTSFNYLSGSIDFTAISTTEAHADTFLENPILTKLSEQDHALFVSEAKGPDQRLPSHIPQAICEMYACAKQLTKTTIRGVLTNGHGWIFLILELGEGGSGGKYFHSHEIPLIQVMLTGEKSVSETACSLIAGIIAHWIQHSHEKIGDDDYFTTNST